MKVGVLLTKIGIGSAAIVEDTAIAVIMKLLALDPRAVVKLLRKLVGFDKAVEITVFMLSWVKL